MAEGTRPAAFLDRDGTILDDPGFLHEPHKTRLLPGAARAIARLNAAGYVVVTVSNQSGIGRGRYRVEDYQAVERRLAELLAAEGARIDGSYCCPHYPPVSGPCACRKPGTKLFHQARETLRIDFAHSWWLGDRVSDIAPAHDLGGRAILVLTGYGTLHQGQARALGVRVAPDLAAAVDAILGAR
jgi:D-glycero-D-manno-heptose 1,7-bisphosphate phosphatase